MELEPFLEAPDDRAEKRRSLGIGEEELVIGTVARLAELKGHDDLLDALADWLKERRNVRLLWVGDGWWRDRLERRIAEAGLRDRIVITGLVDPRRVPAMIRAMDVLVHPSYREGLARALPQALLSGVPVVSYDNDGAPEVCIDGVTGRLVPTGDRDRLLEAIRWMAEHPQERAAMGAEGRRRCERIFSPQTMVDRLESIYNPVLERPAATPLSPAGEETG
jgi:glycosyltransferase involved in cell wall biosynthesis